MQLCKLCRAKTHSSANTSSEALVWLAFVIMTTPRLHASSAPVHLPGSALASLLPSLHEGKWICLMQEIQEERIAMSQTAQTSGCEGEHAAWMSIVCSCFLWKIGVCARCCLVSSLQSTQHWSLDMERACMHASSLRGTDSPDWRTDQPANVQVWCADAVLEAQMA